MKKAVIFLNDGFEEAEALVTADILRRAGAETRLASITGQRGVTGSHGITVMADGLFPQDGGADGADALILPGGPGAAGFIENIPLANVLKTRYSEGAYIAAICAAPVTLGKLGLLKDRAATCYPGMEDGLCAASVRDDTVVADGKVITARGPGAAYAFGLAVAEALLGAEEAARVKAAMVL